MGKEAQALLCLHERVLQALLWGIGGMEIEKFMYHITRTFDDRNLDLVEEWQWQDAIHRTNVRFHMWAVFATRAVSTRHRFFMLSRCRGGYEEGGE